MAEIEKLPLTSLDIKEQQLLKLKELFPEVFSEGNKVDWDKLKLTLGEDIDTGKERFGMNWPGKADCFKTIQQPSIATLVPAREESIDFDTTQNLFIEGDNLEVLKLLQKSYLSKVKMIYIDPPYNTGNEFIYPDNYSETLETYLEYTGQIDGQGRKFTTNTDTDGRFHSKWMNMMYPRLFLAKNLLRDDGVIFISIGDDEYDNLRKIGNELFGEENFVITISRLMKSGGAKGNFFTPNIDYILVYCKDRNYTKFFRASISEGQIDVYYNKLETQGEKAGEYYGEERLYKASLDARPNQRYWIKCPDGSLAIPPGVNFPSNLEEGDKIIPTSEDGVWKWIYDRYKDELKKGNIIFKKTTSTALVNERGEQSNWNIYNKVWLKEQQEKGMVPANFIDKFENRQSAAELKKLDIPFDFAKPVGLIKYLIEISRTEETDIILDFFAGSASTGHAVIEKNNEDGGSRKFICVQLPELTEEASEAFKAGYKTIADISKERIRRVIQKIKTPQTSETAKKSSKEQLGLDLGTNSIGWAMTSNVNVEETSTASSQDLGFRVFKLQKSNFHIWDASIEKTPEAVQTALFNHVNHISPEAEQEAILFELLVKSGFELATPIEKLSMEGKTVFSIAEGELLICLEKQLSNEVIKAMAERQPTRVICLDEGFQNNDQLKTNAVQIMKSKGVVNFRTV